MSDGSLSREEIDQLLSEVDVRAEKEKKMTEVLTTEEIDELLSAINGKDTEPGDFKPAADCRKIKIYDFKRPDKFSKEQIRTVSIIHETVARLTSASVSSICGVMAHIHVASVDQLTYEEFIRSIPTPTTLGIINMSPIKGNAVIEIDPAISFSIIDSLFGGTGEGTKCQHELTDIEKFMMEDILNACVENMQKAFSSVVDLNPKLFCIETNPQFTQIVPPAEMVVLVTLEARLGDVEGMLNVCYPYLTLEPILDRLSASYWYAVKNDPKKIEVNEDNIDVELKAELLKTVVTYKELKELKTGSVIKGNPQRLLKIGALSIGKWKDSKSKINKEIILDEINIFKEKIYMNEKNNVGAEMMLNENAIDSINIQVICELGRTKASLKQVKDFKEGTIIELNTLAGEPINVFANNVLVAKGEVVVIDENFGVRITESVNPEPEKSN